MTTDLEPLISLFRSPQTSHDLSLGEWDQAIRQGYATGTLGRLYHLLQDQGYLECIPAPCRWHLLSACRLAEAHASDIQIEIDEVRQALWVGKLRPVFLKGAAYLIEENRASRGRTFSDVDIFIPKSQLPQAEQLLRWRGWIKSNVDSYDEDYYRRWMHEIPPLVHRQRGSTLDLHHNLLPLTGRIRLDAQKLIDGIPPGSETLPKEDQVLHSAVHLLLESEFDKGFRDLTDLDHLLREYGENPGFWERLYHRAQELGVERLLFYALRYCKRLLNTPVPAGTLESIEKYRPPTPLAKVMDWGFERALASPLSLNRSLANRAAHLLMYIRGHWMRMPLHLLLPHLFRKAFIVPYQERSKAKKENVTAEAQH